MDSHLIFNKIEGSKSANKRISSIAKQRLRMRKMSAAAWRLDYQTTYTVLTLIRQFKKTAGYQFLDKGRKIFLKLDGGNVVFLQHLFDYGLPRILF